MPLKTEQQIADLLVEKEKTKADRPTDMNVVMAYIKYYLNNMDILLLDHKDPVTRADSFDVLFDEAPTYQEIENGTHDLAYFIKLNEVFVRDKGRLAAELTIRRNQIFSSLLNTYEKLKKLGFIYYNGQVVFLEEEREEKDE